MKSKPPATPAMRQSDQCQRWRARKPKSTVVIAMVPVTAMP